MTTSLGVPLAGRLRSPVGVSLAGKLAEGVTLVALATLVPRALGPIGYGRFAVVLAVVQLGGASLALGGPGMMARFVPAADQEDRAGVARALAGRLARFRGLLLLTIAVVAAALSVIVPDRVSPAAAAVIVVAIALDSAATLLCQAGLGLGRTTLWSFRWPLENGVLVVSALALAAWAGHDAAVGAVVVASLAAALVATAAVAASLRSAPAGTPIPAGALRFGVLQGVSGLLGLVMARGAVVSVALLAGSAEETGYAALAIGVALAVSYAVGQAFAVQLPGLAARAVGDPRGAEAAARRLARTATLAIVPVAILAALGLEMIVPAVFGERFGDAVPAFAAALALMPLAPVASLSTQAASLRLRPGIRVWASGLAAAVFLAVAVFAVPAWGALGASVAVLSGTLASVLLVAYILRDVLSRALVLTAVGGSLLTLAIGLWVS
jgi:O-antigen/teichoic acid export membrane protein